MLRAFLPFAPSGGFIASHLGYDPTTGRSRIQRISIPPATLNADPVTFLARSEARNSGTP